MIITISMKDKIKIEETGFTGFGGNGYYYNQIVLPNGDTVIAEGKPRCNSVHFIIDGDTTGEDRHGDMTVAPGWGGSLEPGIYTGQQILDIRISKLKEREEYQILCKDGAAYIEYLREEYSKRLAILDIQYKIDDAAKTIMRTHQDVKELAADEFHRRLKLKGVHTSLIE